MKVALLFVLPFQSVSLVLFGGVFCDRFFVYITDCLTVVDSFLEITVVVFPVL